ncbi:MAG TPA: hypothetical protein VIK89_11245 [Cytophagaceae bacterium]
MTRKLYLQFLTMIVCLVAVNAFSRSVYNEEYTICEKECAEVEVSLGVKYNKEIQVTKKTEKGKNLYIFTPDSKVKDEDLKALENRLKTVAEGFVSLSADKKNEVKVVVDPAVITDERLEWCLRVVTKFYGYSGYYII